MAIPAALVGAAIGFVVPFWLVVTQSKCPPESACDLPGMAGFGWGIMGALIGAIGAAWAVTRFVGRRPFW